MFAYVVKRLISGVLVVTLVSMGIFLLFWYGPTSPAQTVCDRETSNRCGNRIEIYERTLGYDNPVYEEYGKFVKGVFAGRTLTIASNDYPCAAPCLGVSFINKEPVKEALLSRIPATFSVAIGGAFLYLLFGIPIGVAAARRRGSMTDKALVSSFLFLSSIPYYLFALLTWLYLTITFEVPLFSDTGYFSIGAHGPFKWFSGLFLAWVALGIFGCTQYTRFTRGAMVEALSEDYIRTAKAKGVKGRVVVGKHALRAALTPLVTMIGLDFATLLGGAIITENVFAYNGLGVIAFQAYNADDLPTMVGLVILTGTFVIIANIVVDVLYAVIDPRVRVG